MLWKQDEKYQELTPDIETAKVYEYLAVTSRGNSPSEDFTSGITSQIVGNDDEKYLRSFSLPFNRNKLKYFSLFSRYTGTDGMLWSTCYWNSTEQVMYVGYSNNNYFEKAIPVASSIADNVLSLYLYVKGNQNDLFNVKFYSIRGFVTIYALFVF